MTLVGLGNPGIKYYPTRHNVGFWAVDFIYKHAEKILKKWTLACQGEVAHVMLRGEGIILYKPLTFMNLSGKGVKELVDTYKVNLEELMVIHDDVDLPVGVTRLKFNGGSGGHNGIKSIIETLNTSDFWRVKIGIGRPIDGVTSVAEYVLSVPSKDELALIKVALEKTLNMVGLFLEYGRDKAMQYFNTKSNNI